ncbi:hypothetical protein PLESTB_000642000 [Pleodorina starrii]|uniref:Uncharacterized protein n=1 Tax=Pleodorina starrii TaxID=330485 RepID=A0A9W6BIQ7_9CHLO|nr:hypothetical protein PLESTM_001303300 [Pleodorina starrii]GLC52550.1 hypothetical protein PLESTB_000642000 [Pleodorina starrii]GLC71550.1 hypothetical protein PLESTF_001134200 [Pleodorina starrii]
MAARAAAPAGADVMPAVMKAEGFYNQNSQFQRSMIDRSIGFLEQAAAVAPLPTVPGGTFRIVDIGCSQGGNSVAPVSAVLKVLQSRAAASREGAGGGGGGGGGGDVPGRPTPPSGGGGGGGLPLPLLPLPPTPPLAVEVLHVDLPGNDWGSLFEVLYGSSSEVSYMSRPEERHPDLAVFAAAVGRSMYDRLFPPASVHLAMAFCCLHWQPSIPDRRPTDTLTPHCTADSETYAAFRDSANDHLRSFLAMRAEEMVQGGSLVCHLLTYTPGRDKESHASVNRAVLQMVSEGLLSPEDVPQLTLPAFMHQPADVLAILQHQGAATSATPPTSPTPSPTPSSTPSPWLVRAAEEVRVQHPAYEQYRAGRLSRDEVVRALVDGLRAVSEQHFLRVLSRRHGGPREAEGLVCVLYERLEGAVREALGGQQEEEEVEGEDEEGEGREGAGRGGGSGARRRATESSLGGRSVMYLWLQRK